MIILFILCVVLVIWALGIEEEVETHEELKRKIRNKRWEKNEKNRYINGDKRINK